MLAAADEAEEEIHAQRDEHKKEWIFCGLCTCAVCITGSACAAKTYSEKKEEKKKKEKKAGEQAGEKRASGAALVEGYTS